MENNKVYGMDFSKIYQLLVNKALRKGRTKEEADEIIRWLTGYSQAEIEDMLEKPTSYGDFFRNAPELNENRHLIKGVVCGVRVEDIEEPLMREIRYLDKLVDELAKGKAMDKILRERQWKCPKCGRMFAHVNQSHYCGEAPKTIEAYISQQSEEAQDYLRQINDTIKSALPEAVEKISWSMPTYWKKHNLIQFAASKKHIGLYPGPEAVQAFADRLQEYKTSKGTIQFPYHKPLPLTLIAEIAKWCEKQYS